MPWGLDNHGYQATKPALKTRSLITRTGARVSWITLRPRVISALHRDMYVSYGQNVA